MYSAAIGGGGMYSTAMPRDNGKPYQIVIDGEAVVYARTEMPENGESTLTFAGAAIGAGQINWLDWNIHISGDSRVTANGGGGGAGIGGALVMRPSSALGNPEINITIDGNADVYAASEANGAGIGSGYMAYALSQGRLFPSETMRKLLLSAVLEEPESEPAIMTMRRVSQLPAMLR